MAPVVAIKEQLRGPSRMMHPAKQPEDRLMADCAIQRTRRTGPGGQHRNKVETAVVINHKPTGVRAEASERRSPAANLAAAIFRLRVKLALKIRMPLREQPSELWTGRTEGRQIAVNPAHDDFPALLAEALDVLAANAWAPGIAAGFLGVSASQLVKMLKLEPDALTLLNTERQGLNLPRLR